MIRTILALTVALLVWSQSAHAGEILPYVRRPGLLIAEIAKRGAAPVVAEMNQKSSWVGVLDRISEGNRDWLIVALALMQGADGGPSDDLRLAVSRALIASPADVLDLFMGQVQPSEICWAAAESGGHSSLESALGELRSKIASVESVRRPEVAEYRAQCLAALHEDEAGLYSIYGEPAL